ncbi:prepilin-type N-terminal cleavage/methylation domain-containing protein [bacterium]|nr:prepilin-type N-terminal cleavage/methylation domain-containing protein [bacterium]
MSRGFTLIELLIVIAITIILAGVSFPIYGNLQVGARLNESSSLLVQSLRIARERSVSGYNNSDHGVYFLKDAQGDRDEYILYQGSSYVTRNSSYDYPVLLKRGLDLSFPGDVNNYDINFSQGVGYPFNFGSINLAHETKGSLNIVVKESGAVWKN